MYGIPADLDLSVFAGSELIQVCIGSHQVIFNFSSGATLSIEGTWRLTDASGHVIDAACDLRERESYRVHEIIGEKVVANEIAPPSSFELQFASGKCLSVFDESREYETCSIQPGNIAI